jgi:hypothetical protein
VSSSHADRHDITLTRVFQARHFAPDVH